MKVSDVMSPNVVSVSSKDSLSSVFVIIFLNKINAVPVVDAKNKLVGIVTKDDLLKLLYPNVTDFLDEFVDSNDYEEMENKIPDLKSRKVYEVMETKVIFTRKETPAMRALSRMITQRVNQLPVLDEKDRLIGVLTKGDVFYSLFRKTKDYRKSINIAK